MKTDQEIETIFFPKITTPLGPSNASRILPIFEVIPSRQGLEFIFVTLYSAELNIAV